MVELFLILLYAWAAVFTCLLAGVAVRIWWEVRRHGELTAQLRAPVVFVPAAKLKIVPRTIKIKAKR